MIIDAEGLVLGRMASLAAKKALLGEQVIVINAEKAVVSGRKEEIIERNLAKLEIFNKGNYTKGPFHWKRPDRFVRASIRGMLPYKQSRGIEAFGNVMVYIGFPKEVIERERNVKVSEEQMVKPKNLSKNLDSYLTVGEICESIGGTY